jgi:hypothetical protein
MIPEISAHNKTRITTITIQYFTMNKTSLIIILFLQLGLRVWTLATRCADINCRAVSDEFDRQSWKLWQTADHGVQSPKSSHQETKIPFPMPREPGTLFSNFQACHGASTTYGGHDILKTP